MSRPAKEISGNRPAKEISGIAATGALAQLDTNNDGIVSRIEMELVETNRAQSSFRCVGPHLFGAGA